jgi:site-specific recombinase XerC
VLKVNVRDYFGQGRRGWIRLHEKRGKLCEAPCHHKRESYMDEYLAASGFSDDADGPLWRTTGRKTGTPSRLTQPDAYLMIERRARQAGIKTKIGNHSLRAAGITDYLKSEGSLDEARRMANHADTRTTQLYNRCNDTASFREYEKVGI